MTKKLTRKEFFKESAKYALGVSAGVASLNLLKPIPAFANVTEPTWPMPYTELNPDDVLIAAHDAFWSGYACSYGAFFGLWSTVRAALGQSAWDNIPPEIMIYGHGGTAGWGTLCGALNGASAFISAVTEKANSDVLVKELLGWYTLEQLPTQKANQFASEGRFSDQRYTDPLPQNASDSPLCHASVSQWCNIANHKVGDVERKERCARLDGDTAAKAAELLNAFFAGTFTPTYTVSDEAAACLACHGSDGMKGNVASNMHCQPCHGDPHNPNSVTDPEDPVQTFKLEQNYPNPFNPVTKIHFTTMKTGAVSLVVYDLSGRKIKTIVDKQLYLPGGYTVEWNGTDNSGRKVSSGMYFYQLRVGDKVKTKSMILVK